MKNLAQLLAVPFSEHVVTFIYLVAAVTLLSRTTGEANFVPRIISSA